MSDNTPTPSGDWMDKLAEIGRRISAEERDRRPRDQPSGDGARLVATHWSLSPVVGVDIENAAELFTDGLCPVCKMPLGARTEEPMCVRYSDPIGRHCDGVMATPPDGTPRGLLLHLYSDRFLGMLSDAERSSLAWRPVEVMNRKKTKRDLFEFLGSPVHVHSVALRGGYFNPYVCPECGFESAPRYGPVGSLPDWLNPTGDLTYGGQPLTFISSDQLPVPVPTFFTLGTSRGVSSLVVANGRAWPKPASAGIMGISRHPLGVVAPELVAGDPSRDAAG